jgi:hypothetical protein
MQESEMLAIGGLLVAIALLALAAAARVFRRADPPRWTTRGWIGELVTLAIVCTLALGLGYLAAGAVAAFQTGPDFVDLGLLTGVALAAILIARKLSARARPRALEAAGRVPAGIPEPGQTHGNLSVTTAEPATVSASESAPPHRAA